MKFVHLTSLVLGLTATAKAATISLASTMNGNSFMSENAITGSIARINFGNGAANDNDGLYNLANPSQQFGGIDLFPTETAFTIGSLGYNEMLLTSTGVETIPILSLDLSSVSVDISSSARSDWFFGSATTFAFGIIDPTDTITFTDGVLTAVNLSVTASFSTTDLGGNPVTWSGSFAVNGANLSLQIADTENFDSGGFGIFPSTLTADFTGSVNAIPEPSAFLLSGLTSFVFLRRRR